MTHTHTHTHARTHTRTRTHACTHKYINMESVMNITYFCYLEFDVM